MAEIPNTKPGEGAAFNTEGSFGYGFNPGVTPTSAGSSPVPSTSADVITGALSKLQNDDVLSSEVTKFDEAATKIATDLQGGLDKQQGGIKAQYERARIEEKSAGERRLSSASESRRGFATNEALIRQIDAENQKALKDLDLREQEALANGQYEVATKIADLKLSTMKFGIESKQRAFSNKLAIAQFGISLGEMEMKKQEQENKKKDYIAKDFQMDASGNVFFVGVNADGTIDKKSTGIKSRVAGSGTTPDNLGFSQFLVRAGLSGLSEQQGFDVIQGRDDTPPKWFYDKVVGGRGPSYESWVRDRNMVTFSNPDVRTVVSQWANTRNSAKKAAQEDVSPLSQFTSNTPTNMSSVPTASFSSSMVEGTLNVDEGVNKAMEDVMRRAGQ